MKGVVFTAAAVRFRQEPVTGMPDLADALLLTMLVLAVVLVVALWAKRRGFLDRWIVRRDSAASEGALRVEQVLRLSRGTVVYRLTDGRAGFLLVEGRTGVQWLVLPRADGGGEGDAG